jgi:hypothetical protein
MSKRVCMMVAETVAAPIELAVPEAVAEVSAEAVDVGVGAAGATIIIRDCQPNSRRGDGLKALQRDGTLQEALDSFGHWRQQQAQE